jgi:hypothetical protein
MFAALSDTLLPAAPDDCVAVNVGATAATALVAGCREIHAAGAVSRTSTETIAAHRGHRAVGRRMRRGRFDSSAVRC